MRVTNNFQGVSKKISKYALLYFGEGVKSGISIFTRHFNFLYPPIMVFEKKIDIPKKIPNSFIFCLIHTFFATFFNPLPLLESIALLSSIKVRNKNM